MTKIRPATCPAVLVALLLGMGCADLGTNDDRQTTIWNGTLLAEPSFPGLSGQAGALSRPEGTEATIIVMGAQGDARFTWELRLGTCETPGEQIGPDEDYPELVANSSGEATDNAILGPTLSLDAAYHVEARTTTDAGSARAMCGDLVGEETP